MNYFFEQISNGLFDVKKYLKDIRFMKQVMIDLIDFLNKKLEEFDNENLDNVNTIKLLLNTIEDESYPRMRQQLMLLLIFHLYNV